MGTLTGDTPSLADHCPHKLPTSCRLTATPLCCACQDKRPHSSSYSVYIDGIGMVMRGVRWQRYCWFCKEFWHNRVAATSPLMDASETKIPEVPDQTDFLRKWFDYHRGYRLEHKDGLDAAADRVEMRCERPWRDVAPGHLPVVDHAARTMTQQVTRTQRSTDEAEGTSVEATLDELLAAVDAEEETPSTQDPQPRARPASDRRDELTYQLYNAEVHKEECTARRDAALRELEQAEQAVRSVRGRLNQIAREEANAARMARVFGTREDMAQADWVSPLASMFGRAYERYAAAEEVRAEEVRTTSNARSILLDANTTATGTAAMREQVRAWELAAQSHASLSDISAEEVALVQNFEQNFRIMEAFPGGRDAFLAGMGVRPREVPEQPMRTLDDGDDGRPAPQSEAEMTVKMACKICLQQKADTAVLPCGHLVMCSFCADIWMPSRKDDKTQPARTAHCPVCRRHVKKRVKIYTS